MSKAILSIDGGGMKGIVSAVILKELEHYLQEISQNENARLGDYFDLIAGTSTGSILTALYLCPDSSQKPKYSADEVLNFYLTIGEDIFEKQRLFPLFGSKYTTKKFEAVLKDYFKDITIKELVKPCLITSYDTYRRSARFFNSTSANKDPSRNRLLRELVLASCAAPTYFPPVCLTRPDCINCYIDGGVVANNPALCALIESLKFEDCCDIRDIHILSIGNIESYSAYEYEDVKKWGLLEWAIPLFHVFKDSSEQTVDYQLQMLYQSINMKDNYLRIQAMSKDKIPALDDVSKKAAKYFLQTGRDLAQTYQQQLMALAKWLAERKNVL